MSDKEAPNAAVGVRQGGVCTLTTADLLGSTGIFMHNHLLDLRSKEKISDESQMSGEKGDVNKMAQEGGSTAQVSGLTTRRSRRVTTADGHTIPVR